MKYGKYAANNDQVQTRLAKQFLELVSGQSYIPDALLAAEIQTALDNLLSAHRNTNNFYNEPAFARATQRLVGELGHIPSQVNRAYVSALVEVFITNGNGPAWNADPIYRSLIDLFDASQALLAVLSFANPNIASKLQFPLCQQRYRELLGIMKLKVSAAPVKELINAMLDFRGPLDKIKSDSGIKRRVEQLRKIAYP